MSQGTGMNYRSLAGNMVVAFAAQGISFLASVAMSLLVPKVLGVETYGYWQLFIFYASYSGFFMLGLNDGIYLIEGGNTRGEIDKRAVNSQFRFGMAFQLVVAAVIAVIAVVWAPEAQRSFVLLAFALYTVLCNLAGFLGYIFQSMNETKLFSYSTMIDRLVFLAIILVMVFFRVPDFEPYVFAYLISKACSLTYCIVRSRDFFAAGALALTEAVKLSLSSMKVGFALMISNVASMLVLGVARALVDKAWGIEAFGRVSFWLSMVNFFITFVSQASMVLFPALRQGTEGERRAFYRFVRDMMEVTFPVVYLLYFPMAWVLSLWLPQYADTMHYFAILLPVCGALHHWRLRDRIARCRLAWHRRMHRLPFPLVGTALERENWGFHNTRSNRRGRAHRCVCGASALRARACCRPGVFGALRSLFGTEQAFGARHACLDQASAYAREMNGCIARLVWNRYSITQLRKE